MDTISTPPNGIIGVYFATERVNNENSIPVYVQRLVDGIVKITGGDCVVVQVKNKLLGTKDKVFLEASRTLSKNSKFTSSSCKCEVIESLSLLNLLLDALLIQKIQFSFWDFEDHMNSSASSAGKSSSDDSDNSSIKEVDFRNPTASHFIAGFTPTL